jgi:uncharacterized delta-60 repeat protein
MGMGNDGSRRLAGLLRGRRASRPTATFRRVRRVLMPMAEGLEGRTLLSVGLDPTYGFGGVAEVNQPATTATTSYTQTTGAIALQDGQVVQVGTLTATTSVSNTAELQVWRFTTTGSLDTTFGSSGIQTVPSTSGGVTYKVDTDFAPQIAVQSDGSIDVAAVVTPSSQETEELMVAQLTPSGSLDTSFGTAGIELVSFGTNLSLLSVSDNTLAMALGPAGQIVVATTLYSTSTSTSTDVFGVARLNTNGTLDTTFNGTGMATVSFNGSSSTATDDTVYGVVVQPNSSIVLVGQADLPVTGSSSLTGTPSDVAVARLDANGTLDTTFNGTGLLTFSYNLGGNSSDAASAVTLDGTQIVIAGTTTELFTQPTVSANPADVEDLTVTRLNTNGTFDTTFDGTGKFMLSLSQGGITFDTTSTAITTLSDGSVLVGGTAFEQNSSYEANYNGLLVQLTPAGALDTTYGTGGAALLPESISSQVLVQSDGKVLFNTYDGVVRTTAPVPAVASTSIVSTGTGKKVSATGVTITFNTAVNPTLAENVKVYVLRGGKRKKTIRIKKVSLDATGLDLTFSFARTAVGKGFQVVITPGGIVGADGEVLNGGAPITIVIPPATT